MGLATLGSALSDNNKLPLDGIRVIEFSHMVMGPSAGLLLADLGADVIKIEPVTGDKTRKVNEPRICGRIVETTRIVVP